MSKKHMTVAELIDELRRWPGEMSVVVGHPMHDYIQSISADVPELEEAWEFNGKVRDAEWRDLHYAVHPHKGTADIETVLVII